MENREPGGPKIRREPHELYNWENLNESQLKYIRNTTTDPEVRDKANKLLAKRKNEKAEAQKNKDDDTIKGVALSEKM